MAQMPKLRARCGFRIASDIDYGYGSRNVCGRPSPYFEQGYSTKGTKGFGLYFTQQATENLKGHMIVTSEKNEGTTFSLRIPYEPKGK